MIENNRHLALSSQKNLLLFKQTVFIFECQKALMKKTVKLQQKTMWIALRRIDRQLINNILNF